MQITHQSQDRLVIEQKNMLMQIVPWAIGGAGLLLTLGMMDEYGMQSWYRTPYWLGATIAAIGLLVGLTVPVSYKAVLNRRANRVTVQARRGVRTVYYEQYPLGAIDGVRIEQGQPRTRQGESQPRYRLAISVLTDWVALLPDWGEDLHDHKAVARQVQAFLALASESG